MTAKVRFLLSQRCWSSRPLSSTWDQAQDLSSMTRLRHLCHANVSKAFCSNLQFTSRGSLREVPSSESLTARQFTWVLDNLALDHIHKKNMSMIISSGELFAWPCYTRQQNIWISQGAAWVQGVSSLGRSTRPNEARALLRNKTPQRRHLRHRFICCKVFWSIKLFSQMN